MQNLPKTINIDSFNEAHYIACFGCDTKVFAMILDSIENDLSKPRKARVCDKLMATLMFMKIGVTFTALSGIFGVHYTTISDWFKETIFWLSELSKDGIVWWDRETIKVNIINLVQS